LEQQRHQDELPRGYDPERGAPRADRGGDAERQDQRQAGNDGEPGRRLDEEARARWRE
jgi:hypothetical protein